jgi:Predicted membrane protein involved in D-alanine export
VVSRSGSVLFHSIEFLFFFLPVTWVVFLLLVKTGRARGAVAWLTFASLFFYAWWKWEYLALLVGSILVNFFIGCAVCPKTSRLSQPVRLAILVAGLVLNVGALAWFKYANFFVDNLNLLLGASFNLEKIILPLAISFFTFQQIAYIVDAYRGDTHGYTFLEYSFFVSFFPQLIAGPIVHHHEVLPQIDRERWRPVRMENLHVGITIFLIGLFKKMVIADGCAEYATPVFDHAAGGGALSATDAWVGALAYTFQLYFDFSGYSDMATGLARCFGIVLPLNFASPYKALDIVDFWRRWHITLSRFLRDYVYIPLGGNRRGIVLRYSNLMITMLIGGLWHGAGWTFVIWGALHGFYLVVNHAWRAATRNLFARAPIIDTALRPAAWLLTFLVVLVGWVFFRAADPSTAAKLLGTMFGTAAQASAPYPASLAAILAGEMKFIWLALVAGIAFLAPSTQQYLRDFQPALAPGPESRIPRTPAWRPTLGHGLLIGAILFLTIKRYFLLAPTEFLYFNF